jgi:H+/Cl- antiporter ClcA
MIKKYISNSNHPTCIHYLLKWLILTTPIAIVIGTLVAFFLWLLNGAIFFRFSHPYLIYFLPLAGVIVHLIYQAFGKSSEKGNNLIFEEIHQTGDGVPARMGPLVLFSTIITHLFGGSAGREGTAVQIGGSIAQIFGNWFKINQQDVKTLLLSGLAAGFGAVFGTPITGAIFAIEVITIGKLAPKAIVPCLLASFIGDLTVKFLGISHTLYHIDLISSPDFSTSILAQLNLFLILKIILAAIAFGLASFLFSELAHLIKNIFNAVFKVQWLIPLTGGIIIILLLILVGKPDYLSLGVNAEYPGAITISSAFTKGGADTFSWLWKTIFTTVTIGTGFKGGEVTPLFYIGATLGNVLADFLNAPISLFAALGFIAVFAGATNTPMACTIMGAELFGGTYIVYFAIACFVAYFCSGNSGIYGAQKIEKSKFWFYQKTNPINIKEAHERRQNYFLGKLKKYKKA